MAIKAEDLKDFVGGQWIRVADKETEYQGPIRDIIDGEEEGQIVVICEWEAKFDKKTETCLPHDGSPATYALDMSSGKTEIWKDKSELYYNPYSPDSVGWSYHLYRRGSSMEIRIRGAQQGQKKKKRLPLDLDRKTLAALGVGVAGGIAVPLAIRRLRAIKRKRQEQHKEKSRESSG